MFTFTSWKKPNLFLNKYIKESYNKNISGIAVTKAITDFSYDSSSNNKNKDSSNNENKDSSNNENKDSSNDNNIILIILASVTSICFYLFKKY
jgi:hypothetical protein